MHLASPFGFMMYVCALFSLDSCCLSSPLCPTRERVDLYDDQLFKSDDVSYEVVVVLRGS